MPGMPDLTTPKTRGSQFEQRFNDALQRRNPVERRDAIRDLCREFGINRDLDLVVRVDLDNAQAARDLMSKLRGHLDGAPTGPLSSLAPRAANLNAKTGSTRSLFARLAATVKPGGNSLAAATTNKWSVLLDNSPWRSDGASYLAGLVEQVEHLKDVNGTGVEHFGGGNPDILKRRRLVAQLVEANALPEQLAQAPNVKNDLTIIKHVDHVDAYKSSGFGAMSEVHSLLGSYVTEVRKANADRADSQAKKLTAGEVKFFQADHETFSTAVLDRLRDDELRNRTMVDLLLQFRNAEDTNPNFTRQYAGAPAAQAGYELRQLASRVDAQATTPAGQREYALARLLATSLPLSSSNAILEARHLVGTLRRKAWELVYGEKAIPQGYRLNAYEAIHHNFSCDTPKVIAAFVSEKVFQGGRPETFVALVDAMNAARGGATTKATEILDQIRKTDTTIGADWDRFWQAKSDTLGLGDALETFLASRANGKLDSRSPATVTPFLDLMRKLPDGVLTGKKLGDQVDPEKFYAGAGGISASQIAELCQQAKASAAAGGRTNPVQRDLLNAIEKTAGMSYVEADHLSRSAVDAVPGNYAEKLSLIARLYQTVVGASPSAKSLADNLIAARDAVPEVMEVMRLLDNGASPMEVSVATTQARRALREAFAKNPEGFRRMGIWALDRQLEAIASANLGSVVETIGDVSTADQQRAALRGLRTALDSAEIAGLGSIRDLNDTEATDTPTLRDALSAVDGALAEVEKKPTIDAARFHDAIIEAYAAIVDVTENIHEYVGAREPDVSNGTLIPDPAFLDDFIKEGPLHYARAIAQKAMTVGLTQEISATRIINPAGVTALHHMGQVVFDRVLIASSMQDLKRLGAGKNDFVWIPEMDEKKMAAVGGIMSNFPGGFSHAAVYAKNSGIVALSNPDIGVPWMEFAQKLAGANDKLYYDDRNGQIVLMPLQEALKAGLIKPDEVEKRRPGANRDISFLDWKEGRKRWVSFLPFGAKKGRWAEVGHHEQQIDPSRDTHHIEIFKATKVIKGQGAGAVSFADLGNLGVDARGLAGEKGMVLGVMSQEPTLAKYIPPGSQVTAGMVESILEGAGVLNSVRAVWEKDPAVGVVNDKNFLQSRFYTDTAYRDQTRQALQKGVLDAVNAYLVGPDGSPTKAGQEVLTELAQNPELAAENNWITRSSFTAEDRPFKSGAGQYDSFPNRRTAAERLQGIAGVISSWWDAKPVDNSVAEEFNLMHVWPTVTVMKCLNAKFSGVAVSRDTGSGQRRAITYQAKEGFGGGVDGDVTEEGKVFRDRQEVSQTYPGREDSLLTKEQREELRAAVIEIERLFHDKIEPGKGFAVDVEWVIDPTGHLYIVQARTIKI